MQRLAWILLALASSLLFSTIAIAFPENVRLGYQSCTSCHIAPSGGGALTNYGRSVSEEMSSFSYEGAGRVLGVLPLPEWTAIGGDVRYLKAPTAEFFMQKDLELALRPAPYLWIAVAGGVYGPTQTRELRRSSVLWTPTDNLSLRVGRFTPTYGINTPDHTLATRRGLGWDQGAERYAVEGSVHGAVGEVTFSSYIGGTDNLNLDNTGYKFKADQSGATAKLSLNLGDHTRTGFSYWYQGEDARDLLALGAWVEAGITRDLYLLADVSRVVDTNGTEVWRGWADVGFELVRGVHLKARHEYADEQKTTAVLQWFPFPHYELLYQGNKESQTLVAHWWF